jgi:hypothetical protein
MDEECRQGKFATYAAVAARLSVMWTTAPGPKSGSGGNKSAASCVFTDEGLESIRLNPEALGHK